MAQNTSGGELRRFVVVIAIAAVLIIGFKFFLTPMSNAFGKAFAHSVTTSTTKSMAPSLAAASFVPQVRQQVPKVTKGIPDSALVALAVDVCSKTGDANAKPTSQALEGRVTSTLPKATKSQARRVATLAVTSACAANHNNLPWPT